MRPLIVTPKASRLADACPARRRRESPGYMDDPNWGARPVSMRTSNDKTLDMVPSAHSESPTGRAGGGLSLPAATFEDCSSNIRQQTGNLKRYVSGSALEIGECLRGLGTFRVVQGGSTDYLTSSRGSIPRSPSPCPCIAMTVSWLFRTNLGNIFSKFLSDDRHWLLG
jgi:hypothetical protein